MRGLMMDYQLTVPPLVRRAGALFGRRTTASRRPDKTIVRHTYADIIDRAKRLSVGLGQLGVRPGERVATLAWAGHQHLEAYLAIPSMGAVLHTLNLRLHHDDLAYIINDADDRVLLLDESLLPLLERLRSEIRVEHVIVIGGSATGHPRPGRETTDPGQAPGAEFIDYEQLLASADPSRFVEPAIDEHDAAAMCYTSGTTGRPKGILYSHRAIRS